MIWNALSATMRWIWGFPLYAEIVLVTAIFTCSIYANFSFTVGTKEKDKEDYAYFPPFMPRVNANYNQHLGAEYIHIAEAIRAGKGFANPFTRLESGPTAWMPPILPGILASLLWAYDDDMDLVMTTVIFFQVFVLIGTGVLVVHLVRQTCGRWWAALAVVIFILGVICDFHSWFQFTHDCWIVLLGLDLLLAGLCWLRPLQRWSSCVGWGLFGGLSALINPLIALAWGIFTVLLGCHQRNWSRLGISVLVAGLALAPWTMRNYLVFGRFIPVKPNLSYELYQSQCLQPDGLIQNTTFERYHPNSPGAARSRVEYKTLGETAYLDQKRELFLQAVSKDPQNFLDRVADRFLAATLWYESSNRTEKTKRPIAFKITRWTHPLPFLGMLVLLGFAFWKRLHWAEWCTIGLYLIYLTPYVLISYYERYGAPLVGLKVLLVIWAAYHLLSLLPWKAGAKLLQAVLPWQKRAGVTLPVRAVTTTAGSSKPSAVVALSD